MSDRCYENIHTAIEVTARQLKQRLEAVGLGAGHSKTLHFVAHSMGGLVARWFIEREGGNQIVQHLVMLGTPNAGSPWPTVPAWATAALGTGLNSLSSIAWPAKVLGSLVSAIETVDVTLDQLAPHSTFMQSLAASPDPGVPYTALAGNTSLLAAAFDLDRAGQSSRIARFLNTRSSSFFRLTVSACCA
jgi:pimeloyl-ACP methyl ester carboxylesterase